MKFYCVQGEDGAPAPDGIPGKDGSDGGAVEADAVRQEETRN